MTKTKKKEKNMDIMIEAMKQKNKMNLLMIRKKLNKIIAIMNLKMKMIINKLFKIKKI